MSLARAVAANTGVQVIGKVLSIALGVVIVALMTRHLGQEGFGKYSTANAFLQVFAILLDLGLNVMIVQMLGERAGDEPFERRAVSAVFTLRLILGVIVIGLAPFIGLLIPSYDHELRLALFVIAGSFLFTILNQIVIGVQQRHLKMHVVAAGEVLGRITLLIGLIIAITQHWGLIPIVAFVTIGAALNFLVNILIARHYATFTWNVDVAFWKIALKRSWPIGVSILFSLIYYKSDTLVLSFVRPQAEVGIYGAAYRVLDILATFPFMYAGILLPLIANAWMKGDKERFHRMIQRSFDAFCLFVFPLMVGTQLVATQGMRLVAGEQFAASGPVLQILIVATGLIYFATIFSHAIVALDKQRTMLPVYIGTAIVTLAGYVLLIPRYGLWAAAWLTVASELVVGVASFWITIRSANMRLSYATALKTIMASAIMYAAARPFAGDSSFVLPVLIGGLVYTVIVFATGALTKKMIKELIP
jgi:O-antigen/teichoic acid export membrane protein